MFWLGMSSYFTGFALWQIDIYFCGQLRALRAFIGDYGPLLEFHAYWHLGTSFGSYICVVFSMLVRSYALREPLQISWTLGIIPILKNRSRLKHH